jgi:hypothetical protein
VNCGSLVIRECRDLALPWGEEWAFQALLGELLDSAGGLLSLGAQYAESLGPNVTRSLNALRCAFTNIGDNAWNLVAAVYWTLVGVGQEATAKEYLDMGYEWICTCSRDVTNLLEGLLGVESDENSNNNNNNNACSEKAKKEKADAQAEKELERVIEQEKKAADEKVAREEAEAETVANSLLGKNAGELEAAQIESFERFQAKAIELEGKEAPSAEDKAELEKLRREYEATKTAKANIVREGITKELWDARAANGLDGLRAIIADASADQLGLAKIS